MSDVTPDLIFQVATGFMAAKHLFAANEIGLFEKLAEGPATLDELAQRTGIPRRTLLWKGIFSKILFPMGMMSLLSPM